MSFSSPANQFVRAGTAIILTLLVIDFALAMEPICPLLVDPHSVSPQNQSILRTDGLYKDVKNNDSAGALMSALKIGGAPAIRQFTLDYLYEVKNRLQPDGFSSAGLVRMNFSSIVNLLDGHLRTIAVEVLRANLVHPNHEVQDAAVDALREVKDVDEDTILAISDLILTAKSDRVSDSARYTLRSLSLEPAGLRRIVQLLQAFLKTGHSDPSDLRATSLIWALKVEHSSELRSLLAQPDIIAILVRAIQQYKDGKPGVGTLPIEALGNLHATTQIPLLKEILQNPKNNQHIEENGQRFAGQALSEMSSEVAANILIQSLSNPRIRVSIILDLRNCKFDVCRETLIDILKHDKEPYNRKIAATSLGRRGDPKAIPALVEALEDNSAGNRNPEDHPAVDLAAAEALTELKASEAIAAIQKLRGNKSRKDVKEKLDRFLALLGASPDSRETPQRLRPVTRTSAAGGRTFTQAISLQSLQGKIERAYEQTGSYKNLTGQVSKDLGKVHFDDENIVDIDYSISANGLAYAEIKAGGEWEIPLIFIIYWDGKALRGYIPVDGNPWNAKTYVAYGNDFDEDLENIRIRFPAIKIEPDHIRLQTLPDIEPDMTLIGSDISRRIVLRP